MKVTVKAAARILNGLRSLDGSDRVVKDGDKERVVTEPYKFSPEVIWSITNSMAELTELVERFETARNRIVRDLSKGKRSIDPADTATVEAMQDQVEVIMDREEELDLTVLTMPELNLEANKIPPTVLASLRPLLQRHASK